MHSTHHLHSLCRALMPWVVAMWCTSVAAALREPIAVMVYAEAFAPLQYPNEQNEPSGYVYLFVHALLTRVQQQMPITVRPLEFVPLKRALVIGDREENVVLLSVARTPEREAKYIWLTEVSPYQLWLYRAKGHPLPQLKSLDDLKGHALRFGVQNGGNFHEWLRAQGVGQGSDDSVIDPAPQNNLNFRKALAGRIDLFAHPAISFAYRAQQLGLDVGDFEAVLPVQPLSVPLWLLISKRSDPRLVNALRASAKALKASGRFPLLSGPAPK